MNSIQVTFLDLSVCGSEKDGILDTKPVFENIDADLKLNKVEILITEKTIAILAAGYSLETGGKPYSWQCVFASHIPKSETIKLEPHTFHKEEMIRASWIGASFLNRELPLYVKAYNKKLNLEMLLNKRYNLDGANADLTNHHNENLLRPLIKCSAGK
jgi:Zn-dependent alcohol dehydrogenase